MPHEILALPYGRGWTNRYVYELPAAKIERHTWGDEYARPVVIPGAYRSIIFMRPHISPELQLEGVTSNGMEVLRFCTFATKAEGYDKFAAPDTIVQFTTGESEDQVGQAIQEGPGSDAMEVEEDHPMPAPVVERVTPHKPSLCLPDIPYEIGSKMMHGMTAVAFDESVGKLCVGTTGDTDIHVLDFGGENWEVPVIPSP